MTAGNYRSGSNWGKKGVQFTLQDAERIGAAVQQTERGRRGRKGSTLPRAAGGGGQTASVVFATFNGSWFKGSYKTLTLLPGTSTASAYNTMANVASVSGSRNCAVHIYPGVGPSGESDEFRLISVECS
jgi:hypothetical protein